MSEDSILATNKTSVERRATLAWSVQRIAYRCGQEVKARQQMSISYLVNRISLRKKKLGASIQESEERRKQITNSG